jgi:hypothetical protein
MCIAHSAWRGPLNVRAPLLMAASITLMAPPVKAQDTPATDNAHAVRLVPSVNRAVAEQAARLLADRYVDLAKGQQYAGSLRAHADRGDYDGYADPAALANRLTADLQAVAPDGHLRFYPIQPPARGQELAPPPPVATDKAITAQEGGRSIAPGIRAMRWVEPGIAYVSFEHFDDRPEAMAALRRFLSDYASARALIIDSELLANMDMATSVVTQHGAPFPIDGATLKQVAGPSGMTRFEHWSVPTSNAEAWSRMPVFYLTSRHSFSAAEHMAMVLKTTKRAKLIGETTGGGNHFGGTEPVGGGLEMYVPVGRTTEPATGNDWEGIGISPDVSVPAATALDEALRQLRRP